jgi:hypothetical protein
MRLKPFLAAIGVALLIAPASFAATAQFTVSPGVIALGSVPVGTTTETPVTLTNTGDEPLRLSGYSAFGYNGNFRINPGTCTLGMVLAPGETCTFSVIASPFVVGAIRGQFCFSGYGETSFDDVCGRIVGGGIRSR